MAKYVYKERVAKYHKEKLVRVPLNIPREKYDPLKQWAKEHGESVQGMLKRLILQETGIDMRMDS